MILHHLGDWVGTRGGYVGVDVFFVISGFLITGLIRHEIDRGTFTIAAFYERRIRRILPALFAMLVVTSALSAWLLLPEDLADFGKSLVATSLFASNFVFWQEAGYFGPAAETRPLLQGSRLTAFELKKAGIPFTLITDSMVGTFMRQGKIRGVITGADRIARNGDTKQACETQREHGVKKVVLLG